MDTWNIDKHVATCSILPCCSCPARSCRCRVVPLPGRMAQDLSDFVALAAEDLMERFQQAARDSRAERLSLVAAAFGIEA